MRSLKEAVEAIEGYEALKAKYARLLATAKKLLVLCENCEDQSWCESFIRSVNEAADAIREAEEREAEE